MYNATFEAGSYNAGKKTSYIFRLTKHSDIAACFACAIDVGS